jgi:SAM-dependent methyltransferase
MESIACAICDQDQTVSLFASRGFNIVKCRKCGLCYVNPRCFNVEIDDYFEGPYQSSVQDGDALRADVEFVYSEILGNLTTYLRPGRLLDVGCAMGHFMALARKAGWKVHGVECSRFAAEYGRKRWGLPIQQVCDLRDAHLPENHFDACVLMEVAEHLPYPRITFTEVFRVLKPGGMLYVTTPNFSSFSALLQLEDWEVVIPSGHLYYFNAGSLGTLLTSIGFTRLIELTSPADFEDELDAVRAAGNLRIDRATLKETRRQVAVEDAGKLFNGRSEGLIMCAVKPRSEHETASASLRYSGQLPNFDGRLVRASGPEMEGRKVYLVRNGRKHWVRTFDWLHEHGMQIEQTIPVAREILDCILSGPDLD